MIVDKDAVPAVAVARLGGLVLCRSFSEVVLSAALFSLTLAALLVNLGFWSAAIGARNVTDGLLLPVGVAWALTGVLAAAAIATSWVRIVRGASG